MVFMFIMYDTSWMPRKGEVLHCACKIANRVDPLFCSCRHLIEIQDEHKYSNLGSMLYFKLTQNLLSFVLL